MEINDLQTVLVKELPRHINDLRFEHWAVELLCTAKLDGHCKGCLKPIRYAGTLIPGRKLTFQAIRLAATEINMAFRTRWESFTLEASEIGSFLQDRYDGRNKVVETTIAASGVAGSAIVVVRLN